MQNDFVTIKLGAAMRAAVYDLAVAQDIFIGQVVRNAIARDITRCRNAKPPVRADEQLVAPLRARLANDLAHATDWDDLAQRLREKGFSLHAAGGGLALHDHPVGRRLCKASELGFSYSRLMRRFGAPFPGHSHTWLADRMLTTPPASADDVDVIEPY